MSGQDRIKQSWIGGACLVSNYVRKKLQLKLLSWFPFLSSNCFASPSKKKKKKNCFATPCNWLYRISANCLARQNPFSQRVSLASARHRKRINFCLGALASGASGFYRETQDGDPNCLLQLSLLELLRHLLSLIDHLLTLIFIWRSLLLNYLQCYFDLISLF